MKESYQETPPVNQTESFKYILKESIAWSCLASMGHHPWATGWYWCPLSWLPNKTGQIISAQN